MAIRKDLDGVSETFLEFRRSFFEMPERDGPNLSVLSALSEQEKALAIEMLMNEEGYYTAEALGELEAVEAIPYLEEIFLKSSMPNTKIVLASVLWRLGKNCLYEQYLIDFVKKKYFVTESDKVNAILLMRYVCTRGCIDALLNLLKEKNERVRLSACKSLLIMIGLPNSLDSFCDNLLSNDKKIRQKAILTIYELACSVPN